MKADEREAFREALLSGIEPSAELRERFEKQKEELLRPKLSGKARFGRAAVAAVFVATAGFFAFALYLVATAGKELPALARGLMCFCFALGCLSFVASAAYCIIELRRGASAPRRQQEGSVFIPYGYVLVLGIAILIFWPKLGLPLVHAIWGGIWLLFFWVMAVGNIIFYSARWHREDILLEQKRTQLEVALLREEMSRRIDRPHQGG